MKYPTQMQELTESLKALPEHEQGRSLDELPPETMAEALEMASGDLTMRIGRRLKDVIEDPEALRPYARGRFYYAIGEYPKAVQAYQEAIASHERPVDSHNDLGNIFLFMGNKVEAINHLKKAVALGNIAANNNLAMVYAQSDELEMAKTHYKLANRPESDFNLGSLLMEKGQWEEAISHLRKALNNGINRGHYLLACAYLQTDRQKDAEEMMGIAASRGDGRAHCYFADKAALEGNNKLAEKHMKAAEDCGLQKITVSFELPAQSPYGPN